MKISVIATFISLGLVGAGLTSCSSDNNNPRPISTGASGGSSSSAGSSTSGNSSSSSGEGGNASGGNGSGGNATGGNGTGGNGTGGNGTGGNLMEGCTNGVQDGQETQVDCGGPVCAKCVGEACIDSVECVSGVCLNKKCVAPSCSDKLKNGTETDVDCGGPDCMDCQDNSSCLVAEDCTSKICNNGICFPPSCGDGVSNGNETGIDCGGPTCMKCLPGAVCKANNDCVSNNCSQSKCICPPQMVTASAPGNVTYCIDQTEVTNLAYVAFVNTPNIPPQEAFCAWNTTYIPNGGLPPVALSGSPVVNVDWCDAYAYCRIQGKHLCGGLGSIAGDYNKHTDPSSSLWYNACSGQAASLYPYGGQFNPALCTDEGTATQVVTVFDVIQNKPLVSTCAGNFPGVYHLSGNAAEWEDSCNAQTGSGDLCRLRGGSYASSAADVACTADASAARSTTSPEIGFRCCQ